MSERGGVAAGQCEGSIVAEGLRGVNAGLVIYMVAKAWYVALTAIHAPGGGPIATPQVFVTSFPQKVIRKNRRRFYLAELRAAGAA